MMLRSRPTRSCRRSSAASTGSAFAAASARLLAAAIDLDEGAPVPDERLDPGRDRLRHPQQLQRVPGRRRVEDDEVVVRGPPDDEVDHAIEQRDLGEPGRRGGHVDLPVRLRMTFGLNIRSMSRLTSPM